LDISYLDAVTEVAKSGGVRTVGAYVAGLKPTITAQFTANHVYRFAATLNENLINLTLWDETVEKAPRTLAKAWALDSNMRFSENPVVPRNHADHP
jgi:hypothetical protein